MKLYFHNVGTEGAEEDFPKTVFSELPLGLIEESITANYEREAIIDELKAAFPWGRFNCWGVPAGAQSVIRNLSPGDAVLLMKSHAGEGAMPALCQVRVYWHIQLPKLSRVLWGSERFPYIFYFSTERLSLTWYDFIDHVDYAPNYQPPAHFHSVADSRLIEYGGPQGYVRFLRENYLTDAMTGYSIKKGAIHSYLGEANVDYVTQTEKELEKLFREARDNEPVLTSTDEPRSTSVTSSPRSEAFRIGVRKLYGARCAICGRSLRSPDGDPEVQSAHIYPRAKNGSDDVRNGICLCRMHHWAFDAGWIAITDDLNVIVRPGLPQGEEYDFIRNYARKPIVKPLDDRLAPHSVFLQAHRKLRGFE